MTKQTKPARHELADLHAYVVPVSPKMLLETIAVAQGGLHALERERPGYNAGGTIDVHLARLQHLADECRRMRPTGPDGKHGNRHTSECGCKDKPGVTR